MLSDYNTRGEKVRRKHGRSASLKRFTRQELYSLFRDQEDNKLPKRPIKTGITMNTFQ